MGVHKHQCGLEDGVFDPHAGCGCVWEHDDSTIDAPRDEFRAAHRCPRCGKGHWGWKLDEPAPEGSTLKEIIKFLEGRTNEAYYKRR